MNDMFVILSDVWLDNEEVSRQFLFLASYNVLLLVKANCNIFSVEKTMANLAAVLDGYENVEVVPSLFVLMGNFCSRPCNLAFNSFSNLRLVLSM